ncbi:unnamed protein product [Pleuronectes platessa]|uniref:Uncharacterized protein n=1 Tax=Pleuronectes platessa TaxID=8262 RepID=A0A9N7W253_PLEPL|nr:unnamed protein product [Pleuronectes platessa]
MQFGGGGARGMTTPTNRQEEREHRKQRKKETGETDEKPDQRTMTQQGHHRETKDFPTWTSWFLRRLLSCDWFTALFFVTSHIFSERRRLRLLKLLRQLISVVTSLSCPLIGRSACHSFTMTSLPGGFGRGGGRGGGCSHGDSGC